MLTGGNCSQLPFFSSHSEKQRTQKFFIYFSGFHERMAAQRSIGDTHFSRGKIYQHSPSFKQHLKTRLKFKKETLRTHKCKLKLTAQTQLPALLHCPGWWLVHWAVVWLGIRTCPTFLCLFVVFLPSCSHPWYILLPKTKYHNLF